jgi:hypothetical protein
LAGGVLAAEGVVGTVVVVVVVGGSVVVVVVVVGGSVVVVVVVVLGGAVVGLLPGTVVVVVVVVVVGGSVVVVLVVVVGGSVVVVLVVVVVTAAAGPGEAAAEGVDAVSVTDVQAPAFCMVATSVTIWVSDWRSAASSDASFKAARVTDLAASERPSREFLRAVAASLTRARRSDASMPRYSLATTPSPSCGPSGLTFRAGSATELLTYSPLLTYSSIANRRSVRVAASNWLCAAEMSDCAAATCCSRATNMPWSAVTAVMARW